MQYKPLREKLKGGWYLEQEKGENGKEDLILGPLVPITELHESIEDLIMIAS